MQPIKILFVCIGNTCRSPMAESIMNYWIDESELNWETDSAALRSWNVGRRPDKRCVKVLEENGLSTKHYGRMINEVDLYKFDYILGMDEQNVRELDALATTSKPPTMARMAKIELLGSYIGRNEDKIILDPYFSTGMGKFRCAFSQITESCQNFIRDHMYCD